MKNNNYDKGRAGNLKRNFVRRGEVGGGGGGNMLIRAMNNFAADNLI